MTNPYHTLGIKADATPLETERAYQRLRDLYAADTLATYALLDEEQRHERLTAIESAFHAIVSSRSGQDETSPLLPEVAPHSATSPSAAPDPQQFPGSYLRWARQQSGLDLKELAQRTKLNPSRLENIEAQRFEQLPPAVYLRGFVTEYARCLGIAEPRQFAETYLRHMPPPVPED
jgi:hypothetical protein